MATVYSIGGFFISVTCRATELHLTKTRSFWENRHRNTYLHSLRKRFGVGSQMDSIGCFTRVGWFVACAHSDIAVGGCSIGS